MQSDTQSLSTRLRIFAFLGNVPQPFIIDDGHECPEQLEVAARYALVFGVVSDSAVTERQFTAESAIVALKTNSVPRLPIEAVPRFGIELYASIWKRCALNPFLIWIFLRQSLKPILSFLIKAFPP
ncbi:hypothetical protein LB523_12020 [Mesorhizobium sp. ESP-6-4]|uniref:hypothetical protein n=1 Tax=Mesorhizobium sp. ESP-6-4 TaxID=2876624 RepID=UPI001CCFE85C|nr:hypothetical protein [Mesorhizobium sp. ESP-6-4]MBZ9659772.1 hypothetical protein [Mesorhizobium sp. ESP-6-4]